METTFEITNGKHLEILEAALLESQNTTLENGKRFLEEHFVSPLGMELEAYYLDMLGQQISIEGEEFIKKLIMAYKEINEKK
jgi:hypothetical protein